MNTAVSFTPWRSIRDGAIGAAGAAGAESGPRDFAGALESPCATCRTAPCCTHLPIHTFRVDNVADLSYASYLLNFDHIRLGVNRSGDWSAYYVQPCRFLDRESFRCTIHSTPQQPQICVQYNPYTCWYKGALTSMAGGEFLLIDRSRLDALSARVQFDELRNIVEMPTWDEAHELFGDLSDLPQAVSEPPIVDVAYDSWQQVVLSPSPPSRVGEQTTQRPTEEAFSYESMRDPCAGCAAPCCDTLSFHQGTPSNMSTLDFFRFALGFAGVELFLSDTNWWLIVKTRCRHLRDGRCAIYGQPERPLQCKYYDAWKCTYRHEFGFPPPMGTLRVRLEHFDSLVEELRFDKHGALLELPPVDAIRHRVETNWRTRHAATATNGDLAGETVEIEVTVPLPDLI